MQQMDRPTSILFFQSIHFHGIEIPKTTPTSSASKIRG